MLGDADATAIIAAIIAAGVTPSAGEQTAIRTFVSDLKAASLWTPMSAMYGFVGGTAGTHAINWKNPGTNNITWNGTVTHNANGITGNGSDGFGDTGLAENSLNQASLAFGVYSRTNAGINAADIGAFGGGQLYQVLCQDSGGNANYDVPNASAVVGAVANSLGLFTASRTGANVVDGYRNGASVATGVGAGGAGTASAFLILAAFVGVFTNRNLAFAFISSGLTAGNVAALYTAVQALQTSLGRNV